MEPRDNYLTQVRQAKKYFLRYDPRELAAKRGVRAEGDYLYTRMLSREYRICLHDGAVHRLDRDGWQNTESHGEVMTLLDLVCDSKENRYVSGRWKQMTSFGLLFHQEMMETGRDPFLAQLEANPDAFCRTCRALSAQPMAGGDISYAIELFDGLCVWLQYWQGDEEFPSQLRWLWDENALMYLKYETMYFALNLLRQRIRELIKEDSV